MTITEFKQHLTNVNYHYVINPANIYVYDENNLHVASISRSMLGNFTILVKIPENIVTKMLLHFAYTPIEERIANIHTKINLSQKELNSINQIDLTVPYPNPITLTKQQIKTLTSIINQYQKQYPHGVKTNLSDINN